MSRIHLITTCAQSKRLSPGPGLIMGQRDHSGLSMVDLAGAWMESAAKAARQAALPAGELYTGAQWAIARHICRAYEAQVHVLSAGLGLLQASDPVPSYQATFSPGKADTIPALYRDQKKNMQAWWKHLGEHRLPGQAGPRSLSDLMRSHPNDRFLIVASPPYIRAIAADLADGLLGYAALPDPSAQCLIVTSGTSVPKPLGLHTLRSRQAMQSWLGGGAITLNIRLALHVLAQGCTDLSVARDRIEACHDRQIVDPADYAPALAHAS